MAMMAGTAAAGWAGPISCGWFEIEEKVGGDWIVKTMLRGRREEIAEIYAGLSAKYGRAFRVGAHVKRFRDGVP